MALTALMVSFVVCEHPYSTNKAIVGVFDNPASIVEAREKAERHYRNRRPVFTEIPIIINEFVKLPPALGAYQ